MAKNKTERLSLSIDSTLKRQFDALCAIKGLSMSEINEELIKNWVEDNAPPGFFEMFEGSRSQSPSSKSQDSEKK